MDFEKFTDIVKACKKQKPIPLGQYLNIADNGCGDFYMMRIDNGVCLDSIFWYDHETKNITETEYSDILEYLIQVGLKYTH